MTTWTCHARPAAYGGRPCGYLNRGQMTTRFAGKLVEFCAGCGCTKIASDARQCKEEIAASQLDLLPVAPADALPPPRG